MKSEIRIRWIGHSCFEVSENGYSILFDPYRDDYVPGLSPVRERADRVICSHGHKDHDAAEIVEKKAAGASCPFTVTQIRSFHDDQGGMLRGMNDITVLDDGVQRLVHFGDIGVMPEPEEFGVLMPADIVLVPVGGYYTMEPDLVRAMLDRLAPRIVIPMHYREGGMGFPVLHEIGDFLSLCKDVVRYSGSVLTVTPETPVQTAVLAPENRNV